MRLSLRIPEGFVGVVLLLGIVGVAEAAEAVQLQLSLTRSLELWMTEIRFVDQAPDQSVSETRFLIYGERLRQDFGRDDQGYILFDRPSRTVWHVSPHDRRLTGIETGELGDVWPDAWRISKESLPSEPGVLTQLRLNDKLCLEFKSSTLLQREAGLLLEYRQALAANLARLWQETPEALRQPCLLAIDVKYAGIEYSMDMPLAVRYWDGRSRIYQGHDKLHLRAELFELPSGFHKSLIRPASMGIAQRGVKQQAMPQQSVTQPPKMPRKFKSEVADKPSGECD